MSGLLRRVPPPVQGVAHDPVRPQVFDGAEVELAFTGRVFVKGLYGNMACRDDYQRQWKTGRIEFSAA